MAEGNEVRVDPKYTGVPKEIALELQEYEVTYFREDKPIPFCGLLLYPATVRDYEAFTGSSSCLTLNKNTTLDGLRMSNLDFLASKMVGKSNEASLMSYQVQRLAEIVFHIKNGIKCKHCGRVMPYDGPEFREYAANVRSCVENGKAPPPPKCSECGNEEFIEEIKLVKPEGEKNHSLLVDGHAISSSDFDRLRQIILFQNYFDYRDDSWVDPALKADYEARLELERKTNDAHATIEQKVCGLSLVSNYKIDEIYDLTIRHFTMLITMAEDLINYKILKTATMSGFVSLPKGQKIEHWMYKPDRDMYGDAYKSLDSIKAAAGARN